MYIHDENWRNLLHSEMQKPYFKDLENFLYEERKRGYEIYPPDHFIFSALDHTPLDKVKVVIVGQDPYHGKGQAHGLSFSVQKGVKIPPSLKNIFKEMKDDVGGADPASGYLVSWADQGVLLLNATLTVRKGEPKSHHGKGWERFTDTILQILAERKEPIVFILWGKIAEEKVKRVLESTRHHHLILTAAHPSPYSAKNFLGCRHFSKTNAQLVAWKKIPISWNIV
jgi:uracil-DNA glycosylase